MVSVSVRFWVGLLFFLVYSPGMQGKQFHFNHLSINDGLSHNDITSILQDNDGFMWFATRDGLNRFDGNRIRTYRHQISGDVPFDVNFISSICLDKEGNLWIGARGISRYNSETDSLEYFAKATPRGERPSNMISSIKTSPDGNVYFLERDRGVYCYKPESDELSFSPFTEEMKSGKTCSPSALWVSPDNRVWLGGGQGTLFLLDPVSGKYRPVKIDCLQFPNDQLQVITGNESFIYLGFQYSGVVRYDLEKKVFTFVSLKEEHSSGVVFVHDILLDGHVIWVATEQGLYFCDEMSKKVTHLERDYFDPLSLSDNALYTIYKDRDEGIWLGTYFGGVNYLSQTQNRFIEKYYPLVGKPSISGRAVREICQDPQGLIWVGTEDGGLNCFSPGNQEFLFRTVDMRRNHYNIHGLEIVGNELYAGVFAGGLDVLNLSTQKFSHYYVSDDRYNVGNSIYSICYDQKKRVWIGTRKGTYWFSRPSGTFEKIEGLEDLFVHHINEDTDGNIWLATLGQSLVCYTSAGEVKNYRDTLGRAFGFPIDKILSVYEDSSSRLWLGTSGYGMICYDRKRNIFKRYSVAMGLPDNVVYKAVEDYAGNIWFGTNKGLVCLNPDNGKVRVLTRSDGLLTNQFNYSSAFKDRANKLYFGTIEGLIVVDPSEMKDDLRFPPVFITGFQIHGREAEIGTGHVLRKSVTRTDQIILAYDQNSLSFELAVLRYGASQKNTCYVKLEGLENEWVLVDNNLKVAYSNLLPGRYTLKIKSSDSTGRWKEVRRLAIEILPPWWKSAWAYFFYILLSIGASVVLYIYIKKKIERKQSILIQKMEREKEREAYHAKIEFFTNIAHEIKTPLTLIKAPLEFVIGNKTFDSETKESLDTIMKNTDRLLTLTYQLLDFRRVEERRMVLNFEQTDIGMLVQSVYERFRVVAEQRQLCFSFSVPEQPLMAEVDVEAFTKIVSNLFNNALKYGRTRIQVSLAVEGGGRFSVRVSNDGEIIAARMQEKIFEPFVQLSSPGQFSGRGLGLPLARSLAGLHGGSLQLDVTDNRQTCFVVLLPLCRPDDGNLPGELPSASVISGVSTRKPVMLIVEDNLEMLDFVSKKMMNMYHVLRATDGSEAIRVLDESEVDIIVSDIMMPNMDGIELLKTIKSQLDYSHIPVVLLTAKTNLQSKIEGLELGADAYVEKPFSLEFLQAQIQSLLRNRELVKEMFHKRPLTEANVVALTRADELFLKKVNEVIEDNLVNMQLGVDWLAEKLYMSRSSLHRKLKGLSGLAPNDYIRLHRLKKAARLLQEGNYRINEIAAITGFASSSYFTKCFQQHFGILPKNFGRRVTELP